MTLEKKITKPELGLGVFGTEDLLCNAIFIGEMRVELDRDLVNREFEEKLAGVRIQSFAVSNKTDLSI